MFALLLASLGAKAATSVEVNLNAGKAGSLRQGAEAAGLSVDFTAKPDFAALPDVLVWQADDKGARLTEEQFAKIADHVRLGHSLLVTVAPLPGVDAFRFTPISPTTAWQTLIPKNYRGGAAPEIGCGEHDARFFKEAPSFRVPFRYRMRTIDAAELGETRFEKLARKIPYLNIPAAAGEPFVNRPLLNRDWSVRLHAAGDAHDALLMTGRYGAGRVAVFASSGESGTTAFWRDVFAFLAEKPVLRKDPPKVSGIAFASEERSRTITVHADNAADAPVSLPVLARVSAWNGEYVGDYKTFLKLPAGGGGNAKITIPDAGRFRPQALDFFRGYSVRVAVCAPDYTRTLAESSLLLDSSSPLQVELLAPELGSAENPLPGPAANLLKMPDRGGVHVGEYTFRPNETRKFTVSVQNARKNLAPRAKVAAPDAPVPAAAAVLNNYACSQMAPRDFVTVAGFCEGNRDADTTVVFTFPRETELDGAEILCPRAPKPRQLASPGAVTLLADGVEAAAWDDLDKRFAQRPGFAALDWPRRSAREWRLVFHPRAAPPESERIAPRLGEIRLFGPSGASRDITLDFDVVVRPFGGEEIKLDSHLSETVPANSGFTREIDVTMPKLRPGERLGAGRVELTYNGKTVAYVPYLLSAGEDGSYLPARNDAAGKVQTLNHTVSRGLRNWVPDGAGSREAPGSWQTNGDLVFAYSRRLNQTSMNAATDPARLFLSEQGFTHWCNPWGRVPAGDRFMEAAQETFLEKLTNSPAWKDSSAFVYGFGDRWDTGPAANMLYSWQELVEFDRHLKAHGERGLLGRTYRELKEEVGLVMSHPFLAWEFRNYLDNFRQLRDQIESRGKTASFAGQGMPLVPPQCVKELGEKFCGMSDDDTWGAIEEDFPLTVARQMALKAFNPMWKLNCNFVWGWDNAVYVNPHWWMPIGVTETSRRHSTTRNWRIAVEDDGTCASIHGTGFGMNGYSSPLQDENDWQQNWYAAERLVRIRPDGPIGMGLCVGAGVLTDENAFVFSGGGMGGSKTADDLLARSYRIVGEMHRRRVGVPFAANATALANAMFREPLLVPMPSTFSEKERVFVADWAKRRGPILFITDGQAIAPEFAELFAEAETSPADNAISYSRYGVMIDRALEKITTLDWDVAAAIVRARFDTGTIFPEGVSGYGFTSGGRRFVAVEDLREEGREVTVKVRAARRGEAIAMEFNEHRALDVARDGDYWRVTLPLKRGDGNLIMIEEK